MHPTLASTITTLAPAMHLGQRSFTLQQAADNSPTLSQLTALARESGERLKSVEVLIPEALRRAITPGPIDGTNWCLLVNSTAASSKLRQLLPALQSHLCARGWEVTSIRLKVQSKDRTTG